MIAWGRGLAIVALLATWGGVASAGKLAVANVSAEPDIAEEAGAITLLVRSGLLGDDRVLIDAPGGITVGGALVLLDKAGADNAVLMDLGRDGMKMRLTVVVVSTKASPVVKVVRAGDGDVYRLATDAVAHVAATLKLEKTRVPNISLGRLRPFAAALRLRAQNKAAAAAALADAHPSVALAVPAIPTLLADVAAGASDPVAGLIAARAVGDTAYLEKVGAESSDLATAARILTMIAKLDSANAKTELGQKPPKTGIVTLIEAVLAELAGDRKTLEDKITAGLASDQARPMLAFAAQVGGFTKPLQVKLLAAAEKLGASARGVTSLIGLAAAESGVEVPRALALVDARELDESDVKRLAPLVATGADPTALRLRAEIALRLEEEKAVVAIGTFASEAPQDLRAPRYQGWLYESKGKHAEAAKAFEKAGARREMMRALAALNDPQAALKQVDGKPVTPEELALQGQIALLSGNIPEAQKWLQPAEQQAPVNPLIQSILAHLGARTSNAQQLAIGQQISGVTVQMAATPVDPTTTTTTNPTQGGGTNATTTTTTTSGSQSGSGNNKTVVDLAASDPRVLEPLIEAIGLAAEPKSKIVIAELEWNASVFSFRETHPEIVRDMLVKLLSSPPYDMQVIVEPKTFTGKQVPLEALVKMTGELDGALIYHLKPKGSEANISLTYFRRGTTVATQVERDGDVTGAVTFATTKLVVIVGVVLATLLLGLFWFTRTMGRIELQIARTADLDEALCVEITKNPKRPIITDMLAFHNATKAAGTITKRRMATLIASGITLKVPTGGWYVHLYGTYSHGGKLRLVPETCTTHVDVKRGATSEVAFDLIAKLADVTIEVVYDQPKDIQIWANDETARRYLDRDGKVEMQLPVGNHIIHVKTPTDELEMELNITGAKATRMAINVARELRLMKDLELGVDNDAAAELELEISQPAKSSIPFSTSNPGNSFSGTRASSGQSGGMARSLSGPIPKPRVSRAIPVPGDVLFDRYRITEELGRGAMGIVQRAWDEKLEREVAIKLMADDLRAIPEAMALFTAEARALAQLNHTNIVAMYDQITDDDKVYMIMEYVDGHTLEQFITQRGQLPWFEAATMIDQVCAGLAYAHARKVIHRDIKPANIFVATDKTIKLGDFGLARVMREVTIRRTEVRGTPLYMAPEQITGTDVDHRSDLYAIGCTLFELVCGRPPFIEGDILYAQMYSPPPTPSSLVPELPRGVDAIIMKLLEKDPDDRPGSAAEVRTSMRALASM